MKAFAFRKTFHILIWQTSLGIHNQLASIGKRISNSNSLLQKATRVVAQIEDEGFDLLLSEISESFLQLLFRSFVKTTEFDVPNIILQLCPADTFDLNNSSAQGEIFRFRKTLTENGNSHRTAFWTAEFLHGIDQGHLLGRLPIHFDNLVARLDTCTKSWGALDWRHHGKHIISHGDLDP